MPEKEQASISTEPKGFGYGFYTLLHDLAYILSAITIIFVFAVRLVGVSGSSMYPTLVGAEESYGTQGDYLALMSNILCSDYEKGDIIVACLPTFENGKPIVKRVIATQGQTVDFRPDESGQWRVFVDGEAQDEPYIREAMTATGYQTLDFPVTVPEGCYFAMGDNRNNSADSRYPDIGMIDGRYIVGKALMVVLPGQDSNAGGTRSWSRFGTVS